VRAIFVLFVLARAAAADCDQPRCLAIRLHVVPDTRSEFLDDELAGANRRFALIDIGWHVDSIDEVPASFAHVETRAQRDAIAAGRLGGAGVDVFVVDQLDDIDEPGRIYGVTWHRRDGQKYAIVSAEALERTLAHELGHVFGLQHSSYDSIMNPDLPASRERMFAPEELAILRRRLRSISKLGERRARSSAEGGAQY
jgi:Matrixin